VLGNQHSDRRDDQTGKLSIVQIEPLDYSPDEFAGQVRQEVEDREARIVMVDSVVGYQLSLRHRDLDRHLHALCRYLRNMGSRDPHRRGGGITGDFNGHPSTNISHLATRSSSCAIWSWEARYRAIGVLKKRTGDFDKSLRELEITRLRHSRWGVRFTGLAKHPDGHSRARCRREGSFRAAVTDRAAILAVDTNRRNLELLTQQLDNRRVPDPGCREPRGARPAARGASPIGLVLIDLTGFVRTHLERCERLRHADVPSCSDRPAQSHHPAGRHPPRRQHHRGQAVRVPDLLEFIRTLVET